MDGAAERAQSGHMDGSYKPFLYATGDFATARACVLWLAQRVSPATHRRLLVQFFLNPPIGYEPYQRNADQQRLGPPGVAQQRQRNGKDVGHQ